MSLLGLIMGAIDPVGGGGGTTMPTFVAVRMGTAATTAEPAGTTTNDIVLAIAHVEDSTTATYTPATGFTTVDSVVNTVSDNWMAWLAIARRGGSALATNHSFSAGGVQRVHLITIRGCPTGGSAASVIDVYSKNSGGSATASFSAVTTTAENRLLVAGHGRYQWSSSTPGAGLTERGDNAQEASWHTSANAVTAGSWGPFTATHSNGGWSAFLVALKGV